MDDEGIREHIGDGPGQGSRRPQPPAGGLAEVAIHPQAADQKRPGDAEVDQGLGKGMDGEEQTVHRVEQAILGLRGDGIPGHDPGIPEGEDPLPEGFADEGPHRIQLKPQIPSFGGNGVAAEPYRPEEEPPEAKQKDKTPARSASALHARSPFAGCLRRPVGPGVALYFNAGLP